MRKCVLESLLVSCMFSAVFAWGQAGTNSGVIAGEVDDSSGGKVAGAKVEVTSPALIQSARDTVTGEDGLYRIVNLPPGVYNVTASQNGFTTSKREGILITTGFTATVNFSLTPGAVEQTVTVSGEIPVIDTQDSVVQTIVSSAVLESLPIGKSAADYPSLLPGAVAAAGNQDVGGLQGEQAQGFRIHGSATGDYALMRDGMYYGTMHSGGTNQMTSSNPTATQEMQIESSGYSAEDWNLGGHVNIIPKNGGNDLHGNLQADFGTKGLESGNVTPRLQALGVPTPSSIRSLYEVAGGVGGPILKDKLWFFTEARHWISASNQAGATYFFDAQESAPYPNNLYYAADSSRRAYISNTYTDGGLRLTWQATKRNQFTENFIQENNCNCFYTINQGLLAPEATTDHYYQPNWREQATWTFPVNNKLVLWAGFTAVLGNLNMNLRPPDQGGATATSYAVTDSTANFTYSAPAGTSLITEPFTNINENFTASYVTGAHAFKFGYSELQARGSNTFNYTNPSNANGFPQGVGLTMQCQTILTTTGAQYPASSLSAAGLPTTPYEISKIPGVLAPPQIAPGTLNSLGCGAPTSTTTLALLPVQVTENLAPYFNINREEDHAIFGQDQWRVKHLTLNLGLRFDWFQATDPQQTVPANPQFGLAAKVYGAQKNVVDWKDLNPRLGAAYDLFGNGKTVIKASLSRGVITEGNTGIAQLTNPGNGLITATTRSWTDYSGTFNPALDGANFTTAAASGINGALGAANTAGFYLQSNAASVTYANSLTHGWQTRPDDWMMSFSVQRQITQGVAVSFGYYRTWFGNRMVAQNTAIPATGYDQYCVNTTPSQGYGGTPQCNLYDPTDAFKGKANYLVQPASNFSCSSSANPNGGVNAPGCGNETDVFTGVDAIITARYHGLFLQGGVTAGHEVTNYCVEVNSLQDLSWTSNPTPTGTSVIEFGNNNFSTANDAAPCYINPPWYQNLQFKMAAVYTLPWWKIKVSANEQNLPSIPLQGTFSYKGTNVSYLNPTGHASLTTLNGCSSCKVEVVAPQTIFPYGRNNQLDFRLAKDFVIRERWKIEPTADFYNLFNASPILSIGTGYNTTAPGSAGAWQNVTGLLPGRLIKFGLHIDF
jgi:carboxypeptidase family protein